MFEATPNGIACISIHATTISQPVANFLLLFWFKVFIVLFLLYVVLNFIIFLLLGIKNISSNKNINRKNV